jgi:hypothetical protein
VRDQRAYIGEADIYLCSNNNLSPCFIFIWKQETQLTRCVIELRNEFLLA